MASQNLKFTLFHLLPVVLLSVVSVLVLNLPHVRGRSPGTFMKVSSAPINGTVNTIEGDNGDVVDCVDIYKQPAFNHPLLKDHKLQMIPSSSFSQLYQNNSAPDLIQTWHKSGVCSEGMVPIRRRQLQGTQSSMQGPHREYAGVRALSPTGQRFYGGGGRLSVWKPAVSRTRDYSASTLQVTLSKGVFLAAGWIVHPTLYGDFKTRFVTYWTFCNRLIIPLLLAAMTLECEGFVLVDKEFALGAAISPVSTLGADKQIVIAISIALDKKTGNWWLIYHDKTVGYWPAALFTGIPEGAQSLSWGGQILDSIGGGQHTETDMGNGLFPDLGTNKASFVCSISYLDSSLDFQTPRRSTLGLAVTNPLCYDAEIFPKLDPKLGQCFLFGGSGRNPKCP